MLSLNKKLCKSLSSGIIEKEDLFLPTPLNLADHTPALMLLINDSHLWLSDNDFEHNQSDNNSCHENSSEVGIIISCLFVFKFNSLTVKTWILYFHGLHLLSTYSFLLILKVSSTFALFQENSILFV